MHLEVLSNDVRATASQNAHPLLCIHGAASAAWVWRGMLEWFAGEGIRAYAVSFRGHGGSEGLDQLHDFGIMDYVEDVKEVISNMDHPPVLLGHSMGGLVAQKLLESWEAPGAVLLASSPVNGMLRDGFRMFSQWPLRFAEALFRRSILALYETEESTRSLLFTRTTDQSLVREAKQKLSEESWRALVDMTGRIKPNPMAANTPMLVLAGSDDNMVSPSSNRRTADAYGADVQFFDDCGHMMMLESSWPLVAEAIRAWHQKLLS